MIMHIKAKNKYMGKNATTVSFIFHNFPGLENMSFNFHEFPRSVHMLAIASLGPYAMMALCYE